VILEYTELHYLPKKLKSCMNRIYIHVMIPVLSAKNKVANALNVKETESFQATEQAVFVRMGLMKTIPRKIVPLFPLTVEYLGK
jgi:hypothetical protein